MLYNIYKSPSNITYPLKVPESLTEKCLKSYHKSPIGGQTEITRTLNKIQNKYYWPILTKDTTLYIKSCHNYQINKRRTYRSTTINTTFNRPLDRLTFALRRTINTQ